MKRAKRTHSSQPNFRLRPFSRGLLRYLRRLYSRDVFNKAGWGAIAAVPGLALAGPNGESVVAGSVQIARPDASNTHINQTSQSAIVNWSTFSIDGDEFVLIQQPNSSSTILNRVIGSQQSQILGQLQANGRVFLVNPQGVYVGQDASIDVGAITLSALDIKDDDFLAGNYVFSGGPNDAAVENAGTINAADGGFVVLAGDYVNNTGVITATLGTVALAAGDQVTLDVDNDGLVGFAVDEATVAELAGVENLGTIIADGGRVVMTASVANDLVATAVNNEGLVRAHRIEEQGGEIYLSGYGGDVVNAGTIDAAGQSGASGGETIVYSNRDVILEPDSKIVASGSGQAPGGSVRVIANGDLKFRSGAQIEANNGGFVELSGHQGLVTRGEVSVGKGGKVLIDPAILTIQNDSSAPHSSSTGSYGSPCPTSACVGKGFIESQLNSGANVILVADQEITSSGGPFTISATSGSSEGSIGDLEMKIGVVAGGGFSCSAFGVCSGGSTFVNDPTGDINLSDVSIDILGDFLVSAGISAGNVNLGSIRAGNVNITAGSASGNIYIGQTVAMGSFSGSFSSGLATLGGGGIGIAAASTDLILDAAGGNINVAGSVTLTGDSFTGVDIDAGGNISINGNVSAVATTGSADIAITAGGSVNINGNTVAVGPTDAVVDISAGGNVNVTGTARAAANGGGDAQVSVNGSGTVNVGKFVAQGSNASVSVDGGNVTFGAVDVTAQSFGFLGAFANNTLTANGPINISEAGGGFARARLIGAGLTVTNAPINVVAGPGGFGAVDFGSSEGTIPNNVVVNQRVSASGGSGGEIRLYFKNNARTVGAGFLQADEVQVYASGTAPTIDLDTRTPKVFIDIFGGPTAVTINNSSFTGPTDLFFSPSAQFRTATFLANNTLNFNSAFTAHNLLVGAPNGFVNFQAPVFITGASPFAPTLPDLSLFQIMSTRGLVPPSHGPNVQILGGKGINMPNPFVLGGVDPFIKLFGNTGFNTSGLTTTTNASSVLAVFNPINLASPIFFGDTAQIPPPGSLGFFNSVNIQGLPDNGGTTVVIGESFASIPLLSGDVRIGPNEIDLGDRNMFIISRGAVSGDDLVTTNGIFEIIGLAATNIFQTPVITEFDDVNDDQDDEDDDDDLPGSGGDDGNDGESNISEESNSESMECSA